MNLDELKQDAVNELREWIIENPDDDEERADLLKEWEE